MQFVFMCWMKIRCNARLPTGLPNQKNLVVLLSKKSFFKFWHTYSEGLFPGGVAKLLLNLEKSILSRIQTAYYFEGLADFGKIFWKVCQSLLSSTFPVRGRRGRSFLLLIPAIGTETIVVPLAVAFNASFLLLIPAIGTETNPN